MTAKNTAKKTPAKAAKKAAAKKPAAPKKVTAKQAMANRSARVKDEPAPPPMSAKRAAKKAPATSTYKTLAQATGKSKVEHPTKLMWDVCDSMKDQRRKDVIAKAVEMGISYYTARTQYQLWLTAFRNS